MMNVNGLLLVNKPVGISSFDCIRQLRRITGVRKIGHAGTLDPAASGLMLMLFGAACKQAQNFSKLDKTYRAEITLGATSSTGDKEGEINEFPVSNFQTPALEEVEAVLKQFIGGITQVPSAYSAIKINGQEAYKRARRGEVVDMPSRQIEVYKIELISYQYPTLGIEAKVSSGTYIRTLAEDIGKELEVGAYLSRLVRTTVGEYSLDQAVELDLPAEQILAALRRQ